MAAVDPIAYTAQQVEIVLKNKDHATKTIDNAIMFLKRCTDKLTTIDLDSGYCEACERGGPTAESLAKTCSYITKTADELIRLLEFAAGRADSRAEVVGFGDLAKYLTDAQFAQVIEWVQASQKREIDVTPERT